MEPAWMKEIPDESVCNLFYVMFVFYAVVVAFLVVSAVAAALTVKKAGPLFYITMLQGGVSAVLAGTFMLGFYLMCDRTLLKNVTEKFQSKGKGKTKKD